MKMINLDSMSPAWPGYPQAVTAGGFCFISAIMGLNENGELISSWEEVPKEAASMASGFASVDALVAPAGAQSWSVFHQMRSLMASLGGDLNDVLQLHYYQKEKRFFPVYEQVKIKFEPEAPAPGSGIGVCGGSPDGNAWFVIDGIAIAPREWKFNGRRKVARYPGLPVSGSHYSQAVEAGPFIFVAGHLPLDMTKPGFPLIRNYEDIPEQGRFLQTGRSHPDTRNGPIAAQTWFTYEKMRRVLEAAGSKMEDIVVVTVFLQDMNDYHTFHEVHKRFFPHSLPALTVTEFRQVGHKGTLIEIEFTAMRPVEGMQRKVIREAGSIRPSSHSALAVVAGPLIFLSGQAGHDTNGRAVKDLLALPHSVRRDAAALVRATGRPEATLQAVAVFENLKGILKEAGTSLGALARIILYLEDFADFIAFDSVCKHYLPGPKPALSCITIPRVDPVPGTRLVVEATAAME